MRKMKSCLLLTLVLSLCAPIRAVAVTYEMRPGRNKLCSDFAAPTTHNKSVDIMFKHNAQYDAHYTKARKSSTTGVKWEMYQTAKQNVKSYGSTYPTMRSTGNQISARASNGGKQYVPYMQSGNASRIKGFSARHYRKTVASNQIQPNVSTRMNVYVAGESEEDGKGNYWDEEEEAWLPIPGGGGHNVGDKDFHDGQWWYWNGTGWIQIAEITPVGETPYILMLIMLAIYKCLPLIRTRFKNLVKK